MGATLTEQIATGKTPQEAYRKALENATSYYGTQDGYSGAINSKERGFVRVELPARFTYRKFRVASRGLQRRRHGRVSGAGSPVRDLAQAQGRTAKAQARKRLVAAERELRAVERLMAKVEKAIPDSLRYDFANLARTYYDKWGAPLCVEIKGAESKRYSTPRKRGERLYVFFGYAPC